jgi:hypothetical protein
LNSPWNALVSVYPLEARIHRRVILNLSAAQGDFVSVFVFVIVEPILRQQPITAA